MNIIIFTLGWVVGVIGYEFFKSLWQNAAMDWEGVLNFSIAGFVGILIGFGIRNFFKKGES